MLPQEFARRLREKRLSRVTRYVGICGVAWSLYALYFGMTGRYWSMRICVAETAVAVLLVVLSSRLPRWRELTAHLNLLAVVCGVVVEGAFSGGLLSCSPAFLACLGVLAAHQLGIRAAIVWTVAALGGLLLVFLGLSSFDIPLLRRPTEVDKVMIFGGLIAVLYAMSHQAERSFEKQVKRLIYFADGLQEQTRLLSLAEQTAKVGHWHLDTESKMLSASHESRRICGLPENDEKVSLFGFTAGMLEADRARFLRLIEQATASLQDFEIDLEFKNSDSQTRYVTCTGFSEERNDGQRIVFGVLKDETASHQAEKELFLAATRDSLTLLPNRHKFQLHLRESLRYTDETRSQLALLIVDMNGFKEINDTMGHPFGDEVLKLAANRLSEVAGESFVARLGGDEFVVVYRDVQSPLAVSLLGGKLARSVSEAMSVDGRKLNVSASVGAAIYPLDANDRDELLAFADTAMYRCKESGETVRLYESSMTTDLVQRRELEDRLATAVADEEFYLAYQPQLTIDGRIIGFEALIRWVCDGKTVSPFEFIPLLERSGRIVDVGRWVLGEACRQTQEWVKAGYDINISVNISPVQFNDVSFVEGIWESLERCGLPPERLDLELTESVLAEDVSLIASKLDLLKTTGIKISIDDFGTGYSSLAYLQHFPIDRLKIDRAFVKDIPDDDDGTIARSIITMADSLGMTALAEGVETKVQLDFLREHGCEEYQGYFFSKPLDVEDAWELLAKDMGCKERRIRNGAAEPDRSVVPHLITNRSD